MNILMQLGFVMVSTNSNEELFCEVFFKTYVCESFKGNDCEEQYLLKST